MASTSSQNDSLSTESNMKAARKDTSTKNSYSKIKTALPDDQEMILRSYVESISHIVRSSTNEGFRRRCFNAFGVENRRDFEESLWKSIVNVSQKKHGPTDTKPPEDSNEKTEQEVKDDDFMDAEGLEFF